MIGSYIYTALSGNTGITNIVANRIYPVVIPQQTSTPALVYKITGSSPSHTNEGPSKLDRYDFEVVAVAETYERVEALAALIRTALHTYTSNNVQSIRYQNESDNYEPETSQFLRIMNFSLRLKL